MVNSKIVNDIKEHADKEGSGYNNWYCGITDNLEQRLFSDHNIPRGEGRAWWITRNAGDEQTARDTEDYLLQLGFDGREGGGDYATIHVYVYKKISGITKE